MKKQLVHHDGFDVAVNSVALVARPDGDLEFRIPSSDGERVLNRAQVLVSALAARCTDEEWVAEQIDFIAEVRRQLDALDADKKWLN